MHNIMLMIMAETVFTANATAYGWGDTPTSRRQWLIISNVGQQLVWRWHYAP